MLGRRGAAWLLAAPPIAWLVGFFLLPLGLIAAFSLRAGSGVGGAADGWTVSLEQFAELLGTPAFLRLLGVSVLVALGGGRAWRPSLAYPVAYFLTFRAGSPRAALPHAAPHPVRGELPAAGHGLEAHARPGGRASTPLLSWLGLTDEPVSLLLYSRPAVIITLVYVWIPFAALPIYAAMQRIERGAARGGGGPRGRAVGAVLPRHRAAQPARRDRRVLHGLHPDRRRVRDPGPRRRHRRDHVRQHHPGLLHPLGELGRWARRWRCSCWR